jgi:hypothetical protein
MTDRDGGFLSVTKAPNERLPSFSGNHLPRIALIDKSVHKHVDT